MFQGRRWIIYITVCFIVLLASSASAKPRKGVVGHWSFNEGKGDVANDSSLEKNHGELFGGVKWANGGIEGTSLEFDASGGVSIPAQGVESLEQITEAATLAAWIKITGPRENDEPRHKL